MESQVRKAVGERFGGKSVTIEGSTPMVKSHRPDYCWFWH